MTNKHDPISMALTKWKRTKFGALKFKENVSYLLIKYLKLCDWKLLKVDRIKQYIEFEYIVKPKHYRFKEICNQTHHSIDEDKKIKSSYERLMHYLREHWSNGSMFLSRNLEVLKEVLCFLTTEKKDWII